MRQPSQKHVKLLAYSSLLELKVCFALHACLAVAYRFSCNARWPHRSCLLFNRDGKDDLFTFDVSHLYVALSNGDGSFKTLTTTIPANANLQTQAAIADVNGDGKLDAVFGSQTTVEIFTGRGDGSFNPSPLRLAIPPHNGVKVQGSIAVAVGDFDGDGLKDIAVLATPGLGTQPPANTYGSVLFVFFGKGGGKFSGGVPVRGFNRTYTNLYAADLNKDRLDDLVLKQSGSLGDGNAVGIVHSLPGRKFGPEENYCAGTGLADLAIVDLNRDGFPDLVFGNGDYNIEANSATVLMNLGNTTGVTGLISALTEPSDAASSFRVVASLDPPDRSVLTGRVRFFIDGQPVGSANLADNQARITVSKKYPSGLHSLKAEWPGDAEFAGVTLVGEHQVVAGCPTSMSVLTNYNPSPFLTAVTFSATVQSTSGTPAGSVALLDGKTPLATVRLSGGAANFKTPALSPGAHTITAKYLPAAGWASSSSSLQQQVTPINATVSLTFSPSTIYALAPVTLSAKVKGAGPTATGAVQFFLDSSTVGSATLVDGAASFTTSFVTTGDHFVGADYSGNQDYNPGSAPLDTVNVQVNSTATTLTAAPNPALAAQPITFTARVSSSTVAAPVSGTVNFIDNGGQIGSAQLTNGSASVTLSSLAVGTHPIVASYTGTAAFNPSQSTTLSLVIQPANSTTTLSASPNPASVNSTVTLQAVVTGPRQPTGSVVFFDGATQLTKAIAVDVTGTATFNTSSLAAGTHTIVADYSGDPNLNPSASAPLTVTITQ